jgi:hypothetical protein
VGLQALAFFPNGQLLGGWDLQAGVNAFGPAADYDGDGQTEMLVRSSSKIGVLSLNLSTDNVNELPKYELVADTVVPNNTSVGAWSLDTRTNNLGPAANYSPSYGQPTARSLQGAVEAGLFVTSPRRIGILKFPGWQGPSSPMIQRNGTSFGPLLQPDGTHSGHWKLDTAHDQF